MVSVTEKTQLLGGCERSLDRSVLKQSSINLTKITATLTTLTAIGCLADDGVEDSTTSVTTTSPNSSAVIPSTTTLTECAGCQLPIHDRYLLNVLDKSWHQACLRCYDCLSPMTDTCYTKDNLILCRDDFHRRYVQHCAGCEEALRKEDLVRRARDKVFHLNCFVCSICQRRLDTGEQLYIMEGNRFVCQNDFQNATKSSTPSSTSARPDVSLSNGSDCNSDGDDENVDASEDIQLDDVDGDKGDDSAAAKRRGPRTTIKAKQLETLKNAFATTPKPTRHIREQLAVETGLNMRVIQVWFQNRRSKERRMKQLRYGGYRPTRRNRGGREDICQEIFTPDGQPPPPPPFFGQPPPPMSFFCDPYAVQPDRSQLPSFGTESAHAMVHPSEATFSTERTSPLNGGLPTTIMPEFDQEMPPPVFHPLPSVYPTTELKPMAGW